jgi:hypothetical protein
VRALAAALLACTVLAACSVQEWDFGLCTDCDASTPVCTGASCNGTVADANTDGTGPTGDDAADTGLDVTMDVGVDATTDGPSAVSPDVGADGVPEVGVDTGADVGPDVGPDVGRDVGADAPGDGPVDSGPDGLGDGGPCGGCPSATPVCDTLLNRCGQCSTVPTDDHCASHMVCSSMLTCVPEGEDE